MKTYEGTRADQYGTAIIVRDAAGGVEYPLPYCDAYQLERDRFGTHIPGGDTPDSRRFEWGYRGAGPRDTAASLLADWLGEPQPARVVQRFKEDVVARLGGPERGGWTLQGIQVQAWLEANAELVTQAWAEVHEDLRMRAATVDMEDP